jgi:hypothetical protein
MGNAGLNSFNKQIESYEKVETPLQNLLTGVRRAGYTGKVVEQRW